MRERELDEFGSLFKRSIIPTIEVAKIVIDEIVVLRDDSDRAASCSRIAAELEERFGARVSVRDLKGHEDPVAELRKVTDEEKPSLIIAPAPLHLHDSPRDDEALGRFIDELLISTRIPTLLVRKPTEEPVFDRILVKVPGGRHELIEQFSFAFALCRPGGRIRLLHVVDQAELANLAEALEIAPDIDTAKGGKDLLAAIQTRMDHLLRGAVRTAKDAAFTVESALETGDVFEIVPWHAQDASLLIVGSAASHTEFLESRAYELIRRVPDIPVLAL